jgi:hypothetical protein
VYLSASGHRVGGGAWCYCNRNNFAYLDHAAMKAMAKVGPGMILRRPALGSQEFGEVVFEHTHC